MKDIIENFITIVEANHHIEAIEFFYAENAIAHDNLSKEVRSKTKMLENEKNLLLKVNKMISTCIRPYHMTDDFVAIKWRFRFEFKNDTYIDIEEIAWQKWENGKIVSEQFFFDPQQFVPKPFN
jgi:hypothetical protein